MDLLIKSSKSQKNWLQQRVKLKQQMLVDISLIDFTVVNFMSHPLKQLYVKDQSKWTTVR